MLDLINSTEEGTTPLQEKLNKLGNTIYNFDNLMWRFNFEISWWSLFNWGDANKTSI